MGRTLPPSFFRTKPPEPFALEAELKSINRKVEIWKAFDMPRVYPSFMNLDERTRKTIEVLSPLAPVYFGSTVFRLYGLTNQQPGDIDIIFRTTEERDAFIASPLINKVSRKERDYNGYVTSQSCHCRATGIELDLIVHEFDEVVYSTNMCTYPVQDLVQLVLDICNKEYKLKHYNRIVEIATALDTKQ